METNTSLQQEASAKCAECGGTFLTSEMIHHRTARICANCKPIFMQRLAEGALTQTTVMPYAGFWRRVLAAVIDYIIFIVINISIQFLGLPLGTLGAILPWLAGMAYEVILIGMYGATVGKTVCQVRVVRADGAPVSYLLSLGRYFAKLLSAFTLLIGYVIAAFDAEKRTLHDRICNTRVVMG